jgi:hypothetical protein
VKGVEDTWDMIMERGMLKNVLVLPGRAFSPEPEKPCPYFRTSFSNVPDELVDIAFERLALLIREELEIVEFKSIARLTLENPTPARRRHSVTMAMPNNLFAIMESSGRSKDRF